MTPVTGRVWNPADINGMGVFCSALAAHSQGLCMLESRAAQEGLLSAGRLADALQGAATGLAAAEGWKAFLIPLEPVRKQLLLFEDGRQQLQIEFDPSQGRARGLWIDHACAGPGTVVFTVQDGSLRVHYPRPYMVDLAAKRDPGIETTTLRVDVKKLRGQTPACASELLALSGPKAGFRFPLTGQARIGRSPDNEVALPDTSVSRVHAVVDRLDTGYWIRDNGSLNGVILNSVKIAEPVRLEHGDRIQICETEFVFQPATAESGSTDLTDLNRTILADIEPVERLPESHSIR